MLQALDGDMPHPYEEKQRRENLMKGCILVVDDQPRWREQLVEILNSEGYTVEAVATAKEALNVLHQNIYHLLILDIRLEDNNQCNSDGMTLLRSLKERGLDEATKIIMLSAHGTREDMRIAFRDFNVADFLSKDDFDRQHFLDNVRTAFNNHVDVNLNLNIFWADTGAEQAVCHLQIENTRIEQNETLCKRAARELEDLLRRLFLDAESIIVRPLTSIVSRSGTCVLSVQPFYPTGGGQAVVVKFGHLPRIKEEGKHFRDSVRPFISGARHTSIENEARTSLLGGIIYSLLGTGAERWFDFGRFYRLNTREKIASSLYNLFHNICGSWYANQGRLLPRNLTMDYCRQFGSSIEQLENTIKGTLPSITLSHDDLSFTALTANRLFTNPFQVVKERTFIYSTYESITHGDLNQNNILVDNAEGIWLIDFEKTERSHILRDVATLDAVVRFQLLEAEEATLDECLEMEEALLGIAHFSQLDRLSSAFQTTNPALEKAYHITCYLRTLARWAIDRNPRDDMDEYYVALLYNALFTLQFFSLSPRQREYAFLSASLLADKLTKR
jgi:DNA-binding response OmpR family regulator